MMKLNKDTEKAMDELIAVSKRSGAIAVAERVMRMLDLDTPDDIKFDDVANVCRDILEKKTINKYN